MRSISVMLHCLNHLSDNGYKHSDESVLQQYTRRFF
jgi:hypothetical protein